jgi:hypothetical protein
MNNLLRLVKQEEQNKLVEQQNKLNQEIVQSILSGECTVPEDLVTKFNVDYNQVIELFSNQNFINTLAKYSQAKMKISFYANDLPKLDEIIKKGDNKEAISGIKLKAQLTNLVKGERIQETNNFNFFNLEQFVKQSEPVSIPQRESVDVEYERKSG